VALRFERRHLPFRTWYFKRPSGPGGSTPVEECCLELLQGGCLDLLQGGEFELLSCGHVPPPPLCAELPQSGIIFTDVTYNGGLDFNVTHSGTTTTGDRVTFAGNSLAFAATNEFIIADGEGFTFELTDAANLFGGMSVGLGPTVNVPAIDCGNDVIEHPDGCSWLTTFQFPYFRFNFNSHPNFVIIDAGSFATIKPITQNSVYTLLRCGNTVCFYIDNVFMARSPESPYANSRLNIFTLQIDGPPPATSPLVKNVKFMTNITCGT